MKILVLIELGTNCLNTVETQVSSLILLTFVIYMPYNRSEIDSLPWLLMRLFADTYFIQCEFN